MYVHLNNFLLSVVMRGHIPLPWCFLWGNKKRKEEGQNKERIRERKEGVLGCLNLCFQNSVDHRTLYSSVCEHREYAVECSMNSS